jgi:hypothetical protein
MWGEIASAMIGMGPRDQAVHNWLLWHARLDPVEILENGVGRVFTVDQRESPVLAEGGILRDARGRPFPIVHQYDRHAALVAAFSTAGDNG